MGPGRKVMRGAEGAKVEEFVTRKIARQPEAIVWSGLGCLRGAVGRSRGLGVAKLGRVAVCLPRQVGLKRWARWLEWGDFGGEAEVCEDAPDSERVSDRGEQGAVAVAVWAAQGHP